MLLMMIFELLMVGLAKKNLGMGDFFFANIFDEKKNGIIYLINLNKIVVYFYSSCFALLFFFFFFPP